MRRRLIILGGTVVVLMLAWIVPVFTFNTLEDKRIVDIKHLLVEHPRAYPLLSAHEWINEGVGPDTKGVYGRSWASGKLRLVERVQRYGSTVSAFYAYSEHDPLLAYARTARTATIDVPPKLGADQAEIFCGTYATKHGTHQRVCAVWGAWLRYGQYTVYVSVRNAVMSGPTFTSITRHADDVVSRNLL